MNYKPNSKQFLREKKGSSSLTTEAIFNLLRVFSSPSCIYVNKVSPTEIPMNNKLYRNNLTVKQLFKAKCKL